MQQKRQQSVVGLRSLLDSVVECSDIIVAESIKEARDVDPIQFLYRLVAGF